MNNQLIEIPKLPEPIILKLLIRSKLLLEHALSHANSASSLDKSLAINGLDNSIEYILKIISRHLNIETITGKSLNENSLPSLIGEINKFLLSNYKINLPYCTDLKVIRQVRNLVLHGAIDPKPDIDRFSKITERFFNKIFGIFFGISKEELRISTLVENPEVKRHLQLAENYIDSKEFLLSIVSSRDAFENALFYQIKTSDIKLASLPALTEVLKADKLYLFLEKIAEEIELSRLGINLRKYDKFMEYIRYIPNEYSADKSRPYCIIQRDWNYKDASFCYSFVSETIMKWQEEILEPVYNPIFPIDGYVSITKISNVLISKPLEYGCHYIFDKDSMQLFYVDKDLKNKLDKLYPNRIYIYHDKTYREGKLDTIIKYRIKLKNINKKLVTNTPARWEIMFEKFPFAKHRLLYINRIYFLIFNNSLK